MSGARLFFAFAALVGLGFVLADLTDDPEPLPFTKDGVAVLDPEEPLTRIALGSCADQRLPQPIWATIRAEKPDLFLFMGDNVYGDVTGNDPAMPELRAAYEALGNLWGFQRLRREVPILSVWDDHDYGRNDGGADFPLKEQAKALFLGFWGISADSPRAMRPGNYDARIVGPEGQRVQVILLDTRSFRSPLKPTDEKGAPGKERYVPDLDPIHTMLGPTQWRWLEEELRKPAELRLIVSSIQVLAEGHGWERWGNLPRERERLFALIEETGATGVVFLSGDRHVAALYRRTEGMPYPFFEITSSSLNRPATTITDEPGPNRLGPLFNRENYGLISIDWGLKTVSLEVKNATGERELAASVPLAALRPAPPRATAAPIRLFP